MELAKDLLVISNSENTLVYNYFTHSMCIIKSELYNCLPSNVAIEDNVCSTSDLQKLIEKGVLISNRDNYLEKDYRKKYRKQYEQRRIYIETIYYHITQRCNLNCKYCYNKANLNRTEELSTEKIKKLIEIISNMGVKTVIMTGGEALLHKDLCEACVLLKKRNIFVELLTNGTLLGEKRDVLESVDHIIVSLDTFEELDNWRKGLNIKALLTTLKTLEQKYREKIAIRSVIGKYNEESYMQVKMFCEENQYEFIPSLYIPNSLEEVKNMSVRGCGIETIEYGKIDDFGASYCGGGYREIALDANGDIYPCQMLVKKGFKMGNIFGLYDGKIGISEVNTQFMKRNITEVEGCKDCQYKYLCGGGCPAVSYALYDNINTAPGPVCTYLKREIDRKLERVLYQYG